MSTWALLAPGPSASAAVAARVRHLPMGAVGNAYELAPWARFIASTDAGWWRRNPKAKETGADLYSMLKTPDVEQVSIPGMSSSVNSGVLALACAKQAGATRIILLGFDMHGTHFFGPYTNGLRNTPPHQRAQHMKQYREWARLNKGVEVLNATPGSALTVFPMVDLDACLAEPPILARHAA